MGGGPQNPILIKDEHEDDIVSQSQLYLIETSLYFSLKKSQLTSTPRNRSTTKSLQSPSSPTPRPSLQPPLSNQSTSPASKSKS